MKFIPEFKKITIAIISLTSCEGCQMAILDLGEKFLDLLKFVKIKKFHLIGKENKKSKKDKYDIIFVEGSIVNNQQLKILKEARKRAKVLVALGSCAALGGVQEAKRYRQPKKVFKYVYKCVGKNKEADFGPIGKFIKVDFVIPGCPITADDFLQFIYDFLINKITKISAFFKICFSVLPVIFFKIRIIFLTSTSLSSPRQPKQA